MGVLDDLQDAIVAGAVVKALLVPLERITIPVFSCRSAAQSGVLAIAQDVYRFEGMRGFFKGSLLDVARGGIARGVTVGLVDVCKHQFDVADVVAGTIAGATHTILLYPLEVVQTGRRARVGSPGPLETQGTIASLRVMGLRGVQGLYPALGPSLAGFSAFYAIQFGTRRPIQDATESPFAAGFLSSVIACALCNWNNVVRLTMQRRAVEQTEPYKSWMRTLLEEHKAGGFRRFYVGFGVKVIQTSATMGSILVVYEWLREHRLQRQLGSQNVPFTSLRSNASSEQSQNDCLAHIVRAVSGISSQMYTRP